MIRKISLSLVIAAGAFWLASTFALDYPAKTQAVDNLTNAWRPAFTDRALAQSSRDLSTATTFANDFQHKAAPALAQQLNLTPSQFLTVVGKQYPAVGVGMTQLPQILTYFNQFQQTMTAQQKNFHEADAVPTKSLPNTTVHWMFVALGVAAIALGSIGLVVRRRGAGMVTAILGVAVVATTLIISVPTKTRAVDKMTAAFHPIFTAQSVAQARSYVNTLTAMDRQLTAQTLPGLASLLKVTPEQLNTTLASQFPTVAAGLAQLPAMLNRIDALVTAVDLNINNFRLADAIPSRNLPTTDVDGQLLIPAAVLIAAGVAGSFSDRRRRPLPIPTTEDPTQLSPAMPGPKS